MSDRHKGGLESHKILAPYINFNWFKKFGGKGRKGTPQASTSNQGLAQIMSTEGRKWRGEESRGGLEAFQKLREEDLEKVGVLRRKRQNRGRASLKTQ